MDSGIFEKILMIRLKFEFYLEVLYGPFRVNTVRCDISFSSVSNM